MSFRITEQGELDRILGTDDDFFVTSTAGRWNYSLSRTEKRQETVLLIAGLGMHRVEWSPELLSRLHAGGYATLTVDNHDAGLSERVSDVYGLRDLALDLTGVLDMLGLDAVHVVGVSMGGMIAQHVALAAPERTTTLTSLSSTTSARGVGRPAEEAKWIFTTPVPTSRDAYLAYVVRHHVSITSEACRDVDRARRIGEIVWSRGLNPTGFERQLAAIRADGDRTERLSAITSPTLVLHGDEDPMIDLSGGEATAAAIPGSRFERIPGMGHVVTWQAAGPVADQLLSHFSER